MASSTAYSFTGPFAPAAAAATPRTGRAFDAVRDSAAQHITMTPGNGMQPFAQSPGMMPAAAGQGLETLPPATTFQATPPSPPAPPPQQMQQTTAPVDEHAETRRKLSQFCDILATSYCLPDAQREDLQRFALIMVGGLERTDIMARLIQMAVQYQILARLDSTAAEYKLLQEILTDLRGQLETNFSLTADQMKNIRVLCMQMIVQPGRVSYMDLADAVLIELNKPEIQAKFGLTNAFSSPARRAIVISIVRRICSSVRNSLRQDIRDSIGLGGKKKAGAKSLAAFSVHIARKYKSGEDETNLAIDTRASFTIKLALMRAFSLDNVHLLTLPENEDDAADGSEAEQQSTPQRRKASVGRIKKGEDFWSLVETHFAAGAKIHGGFDFTKGTWDGYIAGVLACDEAKFPSPKDAPAHIASTAPQGSAPASSSSAAPSSFTAMASSSTPLGALFSLANM